MVKNKNGLKLLVVLSFLSILTGCGNKDGSQALKEELAKTQEELKYWKGRYDAISIDLRNAKASQRDLGTQLGNIDDTSKTTEEQLLIYAQQITILQAQINQLNATINEQEAIITEQEAIINDQEAALQEFMGGINDQTPYY